MTLQPPGEIACFRLPYNYTINPSTLEYIHAYIDAHTNTNKYTPFTYRYTYRSIHIHAHTSTMDY